MYILYLLTCFMVSPSPSLSLLIYLSKYQGIDAQVEFAAAHEVRVVQVALRDVRLGPACTCMVCVGGWGGVSIDMYVSGLLVHV